MNFDNLAFEMSEKINEQIKMKKLKKEIGIINATYAQYFFQSIKMK